MKPETLEPMELALGTRQAALQRRQIAGVWVLAGRVLLLGFLFGFALRGLSKGTIIRGFIRVPISVLSALPEDVNRTEHTATSVCGACIFVLLDRLDLRMGKEVLEKRLQSRTNMWLISRTTVGMLKSN